MVIAIRLQLVSGSAGLRGKQTGKQAIRNQEDLEYVEGARPSLNLTEEVPWLTLAFGFCLSKVDLHNSSDPHKGLLIPC